MNTTKKINVNFSSLVGLKAELLRKQTEVNEAKLRTEVINNVPKLRKKPKKSKESKSDDKSEKLTDIDDINAHKKSKLMLEAKARLYEQLKKSRKNNETFLVDFTNKPDESEEESEKEEVNDDEMYENEDDWVEYQDCFGRTRKCLPEDLRLMQEKDELVKEEIMNRRGNCSSNNDSSEQRPPVEEKEPEIEIMRRKWEEQTQKLADKADIHYQDILFDEARAHGVGYYAFSQNEEERTKQQQNLINLRKETEQKQKQMKELKEMRDKMEENRLKAARIRQRIRAGLPAEPSEELAETNTKEQISENLDDTPDANDAKDNSTAEENQKIEKTDVDTTENQAEIHENKIKALGELLGKRNHWYEMSQEEWVHKRRKVRDNEFGPVYDNFKSAGYMNSQSSKTCEDKKEVPSDTENSSHSSIAQTDFPSKIDGEYDDDHTEKEKCRESNTTGIFDENGEASTISEDTSDSQTTINKNINEESIAAGLKYLRQRFETNQEH